MNKAFVFAAGLALLTSPAFGQGSPRLADAPYNPTINPADFTHVVTNKYYPRNPGMKATYGKNTSKGAERIEVEVTGETKSVMGVTLLVVREREWVNEQLVEDTKDWIAQDKDGNVWHFGEAVDNYKDGRLVDHDGSWEAGADGAKPSILMLGNPKVGDTYRKEHDPTKGEDSETVAAVGKKVTVPQGTFEDCVQIRDWNSIKDESDQKYYCAGAGLVLKQDGSERLELMTLSTK
jgi:hypothetical protein